MTPRAITALTLLATLLLPGCGPAPEAAAPTAEPAPVEQVAQLLRTCVELGRTSPKSLKEIEKSPFATPGALQALRSGEVVIYWNVNLDEYNGATAIGYEKQTPEQGGWVILGDGAVVEQTAEQFQALPKPPDEKLKPGGARKASR